MLNGSVQDQQAYLNWKIKNIDTGTTIDLERSEDGKNFFHLHYISLNTEIPEGFYRELIGTGKQFYRLKLKSETGDYSFSNIVQLNGMQNSGCTFFPALAHEGQAIYITCLKDGIYEAVFTSLAGYQYHCELTVVNGKGKLTVPISLLAKGLYQLNFNDKNLSSISGGKLVIQ